MDHGQHLDGQGAHRQGHSIHMDIPGQKTRRSCESTINQPLQHLNLPLFPATMIPRLGMILSTYDWPPSVGSSFSRSDTVSPITPPDTDSTRDLMLLGGSDTGPGEEPDIDSKAKSLAVRCWTEDEEFLAKEKIAEWLGGR